MVVAVAWLAFAITGETGGLRQAEAAASAFEAWLYGWTAFPVLMAFSLGLGAAWAAARYARWHRARPWLEQLAELHKEGVALRAHGQGMTETGGVPQFSRAVADWEQRAHRGIAARAKVGGGHLPHASNDDAPRTAREVPVRRTPHRPRVARRTGAALAAAYRAARAREVAFIPTPAQAGNTRARGAG